MMSYWWIYRRHQSVIRDEVRNEKFKERIEPFLINFDDRFRFLRQVKDHRQVHVDQIPNHLYTLTLESRKIRK